MKVPADAVATDLMNLPMPEQGQTQVWNAVITSYPQDSNPLRFGCSQEREVSEILQNNDSSCYHGHHFNDHETPPYQ